jgi:hypothetical protein
MSPMEAKDHLDKFWIKEKDLLDVMFGKFVRTSENEPY